MIRTIVKAKQTQNSFELPDSYIGKNVEIVAIVLDDEEDNQLSLNDATMNSLHSADVLTKDWQSKAEDEVWKDL